MILNTNICFSSERDGAPEPPTRYDPNNSPNSLPPQGPRDPQKHDPSRDEFISVRRYLTISQILALVSLLFGGMLLSGVALVVAIIGRRRAAAGVIAYQGHPLWEALYRSAFVAIVMCAIAFCLNLASMIFLYPLITEMLQTGDYSSLFGFGQQGSSVSPGTGNSTWG